ncbi:MAG TPA: hypothetical protein PK440_02785 [Candidatus Accumulibacter phosphatis]|nr:hypothetical protein [Candidatus Accumulibacter phosphatis]HRQ93925.1 hypothetical protein [Candidatus Accumulibacter phosphatis]
MRSLYGRLVAFVVGLVALAAIVLGGLFHQQLRGQLLAAVSAATTEIAGTALQIDNLIRGEDGAVQEAGQALSGLSGNAHTTQQLLDRFHVQRLAAS